MIKGIIFDMDGVISDTQKLHAKVESMLLGRFGINLKPEEITAKYAGVRTREFFQDLLQEQGREYDLDALMREKWEMMDVLAAEEIESVAGSVNLIRKVFEKKYALAVASASRVRYVESVLSALDVAQYFSFIAGGDMVEKGKPDPEIFLLAASRIDVDPKECVVIEDGRSGMQGAIDGGMKCVGFVRDSNKSYPTKNLVSSLSEINDEFLAKL